jgi:hypothetical protein
LKSVTSIDSWALDSLLTGNFYLSAGNSI